MKRKTIPIIAITVMLTVLVAGCGESRRLNEAKVLAEAYLSELKVQVLDASLCLTDAEAGHFGDLISFVAYSEKYDDDFRIYVNTDDRVTDSYFAVSLGEPARSAFSELLGRTFPDKKPDFELVLNKDVVSSALSGSVFSSIQEANAAVGGAVELVQVYLPAAISDADLEKLLKAMQDEGFFGDLRMADDARVFHISGEKINYTRSDDPPGEVAVYEYQPLGDQS